MFATSRRKAEDSRKWRRKRRIPRNWNMKTMTAYTNVDTPSKHAPDSPNLHLPSIPPPSRPTFYYSHSWLIRTFMHSADVSTPTIFVSWFVVADPLDGLSSLPTKSRLRSVPGGRLRHRAGIPHPKPQFQFQFQFRGLPTSSTICRTVKFSRVPVTYACIASPDFCITIDGSSSRNGPVPNPTFGHVVTHKFGPSPKPKLRPPGSNSSSFDRVGIKSCSVTNSEVGP